MKVKHLLAILMIAVVSCGVFLYYFGQRQKDQLATSSILEEEQNKVVTQGPLKDPFKKPLGITVSQDGKIIVADSDNHRIRIFDDQWKLLQQFGKYGAEKGQFGYPVAVATNSAGEVFVSEIINNRVQVLSNQGNFIRWFPKNPKELISPSAMIIDPIDNVYVFDRGDQVIKVFNQSGELLNKFGTGNSANEKLRFAMGLGLATDGSLLVADSGNRMLKQYNVDGSLRGLITGVQGVPNMGLPRGLAVINQNKFAVVDNLSRKVYLLEKKGQTWKNQVLDHEFVLPDGAHYNEGKLYITDRGDNSIVVFENIR